MYRLYRIFYPYTAGQINILPEIDLCKKMAPTLTFPPDGNSPYPGNPYRTYCPDFPVKKFPPRSMYPHHFGSWPGQSHPFSRLRYNP